MADADRVTAFAEAALPLDGNHRAGDASVALSLLANDPSLAGADFYSACLCGNGDAVARALTADPGLAVRNGGPRGWAPLLYVTFSRLLRGCSEREDGFVRVADAMLRHGADVNAFFMNGDEKETVLYGACGVANNARMTELLLDAGADASDGECAYHSVEFDDLTCTRLLFEAGMNENGRTTALLHKLDYADLGAIEQLLDMGADPNATGMWGKTALHQALLRNRDSAFFELLIARGANVDASSDDGRSVFSLASVMGRRDVVDLLRAQGAKQTLNDKDTFLAACASGDSDGARAMLDTDSQLAEQIDEADRKLIVGAAGAGNSAGVAAMLDAGFDIETRWLWGGTALHHAAWYGRPHAVQLLIERAADIESVNAYNGTPLDTVAWAVNNGPGVRADYINVTSALLTAGADVERVDPFPTGDDEVDALLRARGRSA